MVFNGAIRPSLLLGYATGLLIGRFQPFHLGHLHAVAYALGEADRLLLGIGSSNRSREPANPFTAAERRAMILDSLESAARRRVTVCDIPDVQNHIRWMEVIRDTLPPFDAIFTNDEMTARLYRQQDVPVCSIPYLDRSSLSGTAIRGRMSAGRPWEDLVPAGAARALRHILDGMEWPAPGASGESSVGLSGF